VTENNQKGEIDKKKKPEINKEQRVTLYPIPTRTDSRDIEDPEIKPKRRGYEPEKMK